jgi:hypothetical protein
VSLYSVTWVSSWQAYLILLSTLAVTDPIFALILEVQRVQRGYALCVPQLSL